MQPTNSSPHTANGRPQARPSACLTTAALAALLGVSVRKLERDRQHGTGVPYVKFGRRVLYRGADIEAYLATQRFTSTAEARRAMEDR